MKRRRTTKKLPGFGVNVEVVPNDIIAIKQYIDALTKLRVEWVRMRINYDNPPKLSHLQEFVKECNEHGIDVLGSFANDVPGTLTNLFLSRYRYTSVFEDSERFSSFVTSIVRGLSPSVTHWEILNEIDTPRYSIIRPNPAQYIKILRQLRSVIVRTNNSAKILFAGMLGDGTRKLSPGHSHRFFEESIAQGASILFDIINFHPYTFHSYVSPQGKDAYLRDFERSLERISAWSKQLQKPAWITEIGISPRWVRLSEPEIAEVYWNMYKRARQNGIHFFLWHLVETRSHLYEPGSPEKHFGLLNDDLTPKPLFQELVKLTNSL